MKTTTYLSYNGTVTVTTEDRPIPTREEMAACAKIIRDTARDYMLSRYAPGYGANAVEFVAVLTRGADKRVHEYNSIYHKRAEAEGFKLVRVYELGRA